MKKSKPDELFALAFALPEIRKAVAEGRYEEAHRLSQKYLTGNGTGKGAYQPLGTLDLHFPELGAPPKLYTKIGYIRRSSFRYFQIGRDTLYPNGICLLPR